MGKIAERVLRDIEQALEKKRNLPNNRSPLIQRFLNRVRPGVKRG